MMNREEFWRNFGRALKETITFIVCFLGWGWFIIGMVIYFTGTSFYVTNDEKRMKSMTEVWSKEEEKPYKVEDGFRFYIITGEGAKALKELKNDELQR